MKVLVIDEEFPFRLNTGKRIRTFNLINRLAGRHELIYLCRENGLNPAMKSPILAQRVSSHPEKIGALVLHKACFESDIPTTLRRFLTLLR